MSRRKRVAIAGAAFLILWGLSAYAAGYFIGVESGTELVRGNAGGMWVVAIAYGTLIGFALICALMFLAFRWIERGESRD